MPSLPAAPPPFLRVENLTKIYPTLRRALDEVTLEAGTGVFGLLGPNGAGKSTLMEILSGGLDFEGGTVTLGGAVDLRTQGQRWRRHLGYMPQSFDFVPNMTGREVLEEGALLLGIDPSRVRARIEALLGRVNLAHAAHREAASYSRGMKQRLAIAGVILADPLLLLLDEPTAGLDPEERVFFRELLDEVARERVVILSTHIVSDIERSCSRIGVIVKGRVLFQGPPTEVTRQIHGRVWEIPIQGTDIDDWARSRRLLGIIDRQGRALARVLSDELPAPGAQPSTPTLEDAYMSLIGPQGTSWREADDAGIA